jgi:hypothetical protein
MLAPNHNILLDPILCQERYFRVRIAANTLFRIRFPYNNNIPSIKLSIDPALLKHGLEGDKEAEDDSEDNQEDTGPSISTNRHGHPLRDHPDWAQWLNNLGIKLVRRYERIGEVKDLEEAIRVAELAVK